MSFDLSLSNSGWTVGTYNKETREINITNYGAISTKRFNRHGTGKRLEVIAKELMKLYKEHEPDVVVKERSFSNFRITATQQIFKVNGVWELFTYRKGYESFEELTATQVKKYVAGKGNAKKELVRQRVNELIDANITDNDITDSVAVLYAYLIHNDLINDL